MYIDFRCFFGRLFCCRSSSDDSTKLKTGRSIGSTFRKMVHENKMLQKNENLATMETHFKRILDKNNNFFNTYRERTTPLERVKIRKQIAEALINTTVKREIPFYLYHAIHDNMYLKYSDLSKLPHQPLIRRKPIIDIVQIKMTKELKKKQKEEDSFDVYIKDHNIRI